MRRYPEAEPTEEDDGYEEVVGETWFANVTPKYTIAEKRRRGTWWQRMRKRLSGAA